MAKNTSTQKMLDTTEYVSVLKTLVEEGKEVSMIVWGGSMNPFLVHARDRVFFCAPERPLRRGDIVFYRRDNGQYVMHRICRVKWDGYYMAGDAQTQLEGPIRREQVFARVTQVERKGVWISEGDFRWKFFAGYWTVLRPFRRGLLRMANRMLRLVRSMTRSTNAGR